VCADEAGEAGGYFWASRAAAAADLKPGVVVMGRQARKGNWVLATVTDVSEVGSGYLAVSAPFKLQLKGLRILVE